MYNMKLIKTTNGNLHFRLTDGRIGICYTSGYVRVSTKRRNIYTDKFKMYQINKVIKLPPNTNGNHFPMYERQLITNFVSRVQRLLNFDNKNCQPKPYQYNTKYGR